MSIFDTESIYTLLDARVEDREKAIKEGLHLPDLAADDPFDFLKEIKKVKFVNPNKRVPFESVRFGLINIIKTIRIPHNKVTFYMQYATLGTPARHFSGRTGSTFLLQMAVDFLFHYQIEEEVLSNQYALGAMVYAICIIRDIQTRNETGTKPLAEVEKEYFAKVRGTIENYLAAYVLSKK